MFCKTERFFQQLEFYKLTKLNLIDLSMIKKDLISAVLIYYFKMTKCPLNFVHLKKLSSGLIKQCIFRICFRGITFMKNMIHPMHLIILISHIDLTI